MSSVRGRKRRHRRGRADLQKLADEACSLTAAAPTCSHQQSIGSRHLFSIALPPLLVGFHAFSSDAPRSSPLQGLHAVASTRQACAALLGPDLQHGRLVSIYVMSLIMPLQLGRGAITHHLTFITGWALG